MKKEQLTKSKSTKKIEKTLDVIDEASIRDIKPIIVDLIRYEYTANSFLTDLHLALNGTSPDYCVSTHEIIAECYQIPSKEEEVYNIMHKYTHGFLKPLESAKLAEDEICRLHFDTVEGEDSAIVVFTEKMFKRLLLNGAIMTKCLNAIEGVKCINTKEQVFENNATTGDPFDYGCINDFIHFMLMGDNGNDDTRNMVYATIAQLSCCDFEQKKTLDKNLIEACSSIQSFLYYNLKITKIA